jgi:hypothetical protein
MSGATTSQHTLWRPSREGTPIRRGCPIREFKLDDDRVWRAETFYRIEERRPNFVVCRNEHQN